MRLRWVVTVALVALLPSPVPAEVYVKAQQGRLTVRAQREPLSKVLATIARETGLAITYQAQAPSTLISINLENVTPQDAVMKLFEGHGLNYIFTLDPAQTKVAVLIITGGGTAARASTQPAAHSNPGNPQPYAEEEPEMVNDDAEPEEEVVEHPDTPEGQMQEQAPPANLGISSSQWNQPPGAIVLPGQPPPGGFGGAPGGTPGVVTGQPVFPAAASMGGPPPPPHIQQPITQPRFPGGASQPQD